ncbi:MAG: hypothetical protein MSC30_11095 [Gaiellaceae bacterium MAG52_C11]|nr:hypothetical protein [Candidatus Gaiellasilicea maunaloa]
MIVGITSLGEGRTPIRTRLILWLVHSLGGLVGGTATAIVVVLASAPLRAFVPYEGRLGLCAVLLGFLLLVDLRVIRMTSRRRQVAATWTTRYGNGRAYFLYGAFLGAGVATYVPYAITYGIFATALLILPLELALVAGGLFGLGRALGIGIGVLPNPIPQNVSRVLYGLPVGQRTASYLSVALLLVLFGMVVVST